MAQEKNTGWRRVVRAAGYSWQGLRSVFASEAAFRQELALCALLTPVALWLDVTRPERALLVASLLLVLIVELLNSAVEAVVDRIGEERHELSAKAKDAGSAAVLLALLAAGIVWAVILFG